LVIIAPPQLDRVEALLATRSAAPVPQRLTARPPLSIPPIFRRHQMNFLETIEGLAANMQKSGAHIGPCLRSTHPAHIAYGTLHRIERTLFDSAKQLEQILAQASQELRTKLESMQANNDR
jgi:hypothetical protein